MYIKNYENFLNEAMKYKKLYHGSPNLFKNFNNEMIFLSDTMQFANDYANQKSSELALDTVPKIYEVEVLTDIFDINDKKNYNELEKVLPDMIWYPYNKRGNEKSPKEDILFNMLGYKKNKPYEKAIGKKVGDIIEYDVSSTQIEKYIVYDVDSEYAYAYSKSYLDDTLNVVRSERKINIPHYYNEQYKKYEPVINFVENYAKIDTGKKNILNDIRQLYFIQFMNNEKDRPYGIDIIPLNEIDKFNKLNEKCIDDIIEYMVEEKLNIKSFNIVEQIINLSSTWYYFENETILNAIKKLGYGGYIAKENSVNTYAIFKPKDSTKIIKYHYRNSTFESWDDFKQISNYTLGM